MRLAVSTPTTTSQAICCSSTGQTQSHGCSRHVGAFANAGRSAALCGHSGRSQRLVLAQGTGGNEEGSSKKRQMSLGETLLDGITAGRKLRRWYGAPDLNDLPEDDDDVDAGPMSTRDQPDAANDDGASEAGGGGAVLVLDSDGPTGEQVVLRLILRRAPVLLLVRDTAAAKASYGPYTTPLEGTASDAAALKRALAGAAAVVVAGRVTPALEKALAAGGWKGRAVLASTAGSKQAGLLGLLGGGGDSSLLRDEAREASLRAACFSGGAQCTIVRAPGVSDAPGGAEALRITGGGVNDVGGSGGPISREDLARVVAAAALAPTPPPADVLVSSAGAGVPPSDDELEGALGALRAVSPA